MMAQKDEVTYSSITLFSEQARVDRLRLTLTTLISIFVILLISELFFNELSTSTSNLVLSIYIYRPFAP